MTGAFLGDCRHLALASRVVQTVVTSPPYWGLRNYGVLGQLGLEPTPEAYVTNLVIAFREVWRVLRDDGTLWLNLGDSYFPNPGNGRGGEGAGITGGQPHRSGMKRGSGHPSLKAKDLVGIPWMVAFALRADGWYLRSEVIWSKTNGLPESVKDRPVRSHETLFLLSKSPRYVYDSEAVKEPAVGKPKGAWSSFRRDGSKRGASICPSSPDPSHRSDRPSVAYEGSLRNRRSVWSMAVIPDRSAHFATFPEALVEPCLLAGCPPGGLVFDPFFGSGTVGRVALRLGRRYCGSDLSFPYLSEIALPRLKVQRGFGL